MYSKNEVKIFCKNIIFLMQKNNLTEKEMMKILNVGTITFENIKNNILSRNITVGTLFLICRCFNVTPSEMFVDLSNM